MIIVVAKELYEFIVEIIKDLNLGNIDKDFNELNEEEMAVFTVRARIIIHKMMGGWV